MKAADSMNDLIQRITNAIIKQEGMSLNYSNPGNLRAAPWRMNPLIANGFWQPATRAEGVAGIAHVVALHIAEGNTLTQLISRWAPEADGTDPTVYIADLMQWTGIPDATVPLWNYMS